MYCVKSDGIAIEYWCFLRLLLFVTNEFILLIAATLDTLLKYKPISVNTTTAPFISFVVKSENG